MQIDPSWEAWYKFFAFDYAQQTNLNTRVSDVSKSVKRIPSGQFDSNAFLWIIHSKQIWMQGFLHT